MSAVHPEFRDEEIHASKDIILSVLSTFQSL